MSETSSASVGVGPGPTASARAVAFHDAYARAMASGASETELVRLAFTQCHKMVFSVANRITGSCWEAEDIAQSVFETFVRRLRTIRDPSRIPGFLKTCAVRLALKQERQGKWRRERAAAALSGAEQRTRTNEAMIAASLRTLLERLEPEERTAVVLRYAELHTNPEVAELMGLSVATARRRIEAGRAKLVSLVGEAKVDELLSGKKVES